MNALNRMSKNTAAFFVQAAVAFGVSFVGALGGIYFLPLDSWQRLFLGMTVLFLVTSSFTLAKVIRDDHLTWLTFGVLARLRLVDVLFSVRSRRNLNTKVGP